jgi:uncharacterized protein (DUF4415 family)
MTAGCAIEMGSLICEESARYNRGYQMTIDRARRSSDPRQAAEAAFKAATTKPSEPGLKKPSLPNVKELVSLRIDRDVLEHFQGTGPGWQDRINEALRKVAGK